MFLACRQACTSTTQCLPLRGSLLRQSWVRYSSGQAFRPWESKHPDAWFSCRPGENGFLPRGTPIAELPPKYSKVNDLLNRMRIGEGGLLAKGEFGSAVETELDVIDVSGETDPALLAALHRDYSFLASAYSLEPAHLRLGKGDGVYGQARTYLPASISEPLLQLGSKLGVFPWLDYAHGYGLNNAVLRDGGFSTRYDDYDTIRMFNGSASESGFINVHVAMVAQTGTLLSHQQDSLRAAATGDTQGLAEALNAHSRVLNSIVSTLETMWAASKPSAYLSFRTFIMGQTGNANCYPEEKINFVRLDGSVESHAYRGETGAQDSIVPSVDNLLQLDYPRNKLTEYLWDLRGKHTIHLSFHTFVYKYIYVCRAFLGFVFACIAHRLIHITECIDEVKLTFLCRFRVIVLCSISSC